MSARFFWLLLWARGKITLPCKTACWTCEHVVCCLILSLYSYTLPEGCIWSACSHLARCAVVEMPCSCCSSCHCSKGYSPAGLSLHNTEHVNTCIILPLLTHQAYPEACDLKPQLGAHQQALAPLALHDIVTFHEENLKHVCMVPLQNAMKQPHEQKFRRLRTHNAAFQQRAGRFQPAIDILQVAGFVREGQTGSVEASLALKRDDPGLLWLTLSAVQSALEHAAPDNVSRHHMAA